LIYLPHQTVNFPGRLGDKAPHSITSTLWGPDKSPNEVSLKLLCPVRQLSYQ
jgi:hypothetical protein